jgi:hypothetical protein
MLLGPDDFTLEQAALIKRHRLHQALLHGAGIVCGLAVRQDPAAPSLLRVTPGLAIDPLGRDLYLDREQCLDVSGLQADGAFRSQLGNGTAYVVIRYSPQPGDPRPALSAACDDGSDPPYARIDDGVQINLEASPPPDPFDPLLRTADDLSRLWRVEVDAPVLLGSVVLQGSTGSATTVGSVSGEGRVLVPDLSPLAARLSGDRLRVGAITASVGTAASQSALVIDFTRPVKQPTVASAISAYRYDDNAGWQSIAVTGAPSYSANGTRVTLSIPALAANTIYQVVLVGDGAQPILGDDGQPLAGWASDPLPQDGRGRNVSVVGKVGA